jgi:hypothetical protein
LRLAGAYGVKLYQLLGPEPPKTMLTKKRINKPGN